MGFKRAPSVPKPRVMSTTGHYRPPTPKMKGLSKMNMPTRGRVGKQIPSMPKLWKPPKPFG